MLEQTLIYTPPIVKTSIYTFAERANIAVVEKTCNTDFHCNDYDDLIPQKPGHKAA